MFDIGWSELVVIGVVALVAIGPKELPGVLRMIGQWMGKARRMASEFQGQFQEAMREAEMADLKKSFDEVREATSGLATNNVLTKLSQDVNETMAIDKAVADTAPVEPTAAEPGTPETFVEATAHDAATTEPLHIMPQATEPAHLPVAAESHAVAAADSFPPDLGKDLTTDLIKDAKAS
jgi:sec-independent protein translocase protein TatB